MEFRSHMELPYLNGYPETIIEAVRKRVQNQSLGDYLLGKYPQANSIRSDKQLFDYVQGMKNSFMRKEGPLAKIHFDNKMRDLRGALGTNTLVNRIHGSKVKSKNEIRISAVFKNAPAPFLSMICAHELAHLREREHNKAFYQLCIYMEPDYAILELDTRLYLSFLDCFNKDLYPS